MFFDEVVCAKAAQVIFHSSLMHERGVILLYEDKKRTLPADSMLDGVQIESLSVSGD